MEGTSWPVGISGAIVLDRLVAENSAALWKLSCGRQPEVVWTRRPDGQIRLYGRQKRRRGARVSDSRWHYRLIERLFVIQTDLRPAGRAAAVLTSIRNQSA